MSRLADAERVYVRLLRNAAALVRSPRFTDPETREGIAAALEEWAEDIAAMRDVRRRLLDLTDRFLKEIL